MEAPLAWAVSLSCISLPLAMLLFEGFARSRFAFTLLAILPGRLQGRMWYSDSVRSLSNKFHGKAIRRMIESKCHTPVRYPALLRELALLFIRNLMPSKELLHPSKCGVLEGNTPDPRSRSWQASEAAKP